MREVFWLVILDGYIRVVFVEIDDSSGSDLDQNVCPGWSGRWNSYRDTLDYSIIWVSSRNKPHGDSGR